jgi:hypothetical protein
MGKSRGAKALFTVAGFFLGAGGFGQGLFGLSGASASIMGGLYGASLASNIWSAIHPDQPKSTYNFDAVINAVDNEMMIPVIYGTRKWGGLESYHSVSSDSQSLTKDVIVCEGEVEEISGVTANAKLISEGVIFCIQNIVYPDASIKIYKTGSPTADDKVMELYAGGNLVRIPLQNKVDLLQDRSNEHCCSTIKLAQYIEELGNGWVITEFAGVEANPEAIYDIVDTAYVSGHGSTGKTLTINTTWVSSGAFAIAGAAPCYNLPIQIRMNGIQNCSFESHLGSPAQSPPNNYATVGSYKNCAWIRSNLKISDDLQGYNPTVACVVKGRKIYDTRKGIVSYSENPSMCLRDYLLNKRFGMGRWIVADMIDEDSFKKVADYCDGSITYVDAYGHIVTEPRYRLNIIFAEKRKHIDNIQDILAAFGGFLVFSGNKIYLRVEKQESISYTFNESNIKRNSIKFETSDLENCPNRYTVKYFDPGQNWVGIKVIADDTADQNQRGKVINKDVQLNGVTSQGQALRLARIFRAINRLCPVNVTFTTGTHAMHLQPGDIITLTYRSLDNMPFRITELKENKGEWTIKAQQYNSSIYDDALGAQIQVKKYTQVDNALSDVVPNVTNIQSTQTYYKQKDGTIVSDLILNWNCNYTFLNKYVIDYSLDNGVSWNNAGTTKDTTFTIHNALAQKYYLVRIKVENTVGRMSNGVTTPSIFIIGKDDPPPDVDFFTVEELRGRTKRFYWTLNNPPIDLAGYKIKYNKGASSFWNNATALHSGLLTQAPFETLAIGSGLYTVMIKAVDNSGNESKNSANIVIGIGDEEVENVIITEEYAPDFVGTKTNCSVIDGQLVVNDNGSLMYTNIDTSPIYTSDNAYFYAATFDGMEYEDVFAPDDSGYFFMKFEGQGDYQLFYKKSFPDVMFPSDLAYFWTNDNNQLWIENTNWTPYVNKFASIVDEYGIKCVIKPGVQGIISSLTANVDVPDISEKFNDVIVPINGVRLTPRSPYRNITNVQITLQDDGGTAKSAKILDKNPAYGALIKVYDSNGNATTGLIDAVQQGY